MKKFNEINASTEGSFEFMALVTAVSVRPTKTGKDFLDLELTTREGVLKAKKWSATEADKSIKVGDVIKGNAKINVYQGSLSLVLSDMTPVSVDPSEFKLTVIEPVDSLVDEFYGYVEAIENENLKTIVLDLLSKDEIKDNFFKHPAAKSCHHAEENGLLYHTTRMLRAANALVDVYNKITKVVDRDLIFAGIIFHDMGKIKEMAMTAAGNGEYTKYALIGHIVMGAIEVSRYADKGMISEETAFQLEHIILAHHGKLEYGSPVVPATPEAVLVSMVDNLDAKLFACQNDMLRIQPGEIARDGNFTLEGAHVYYPPTL